MASATRFLAEQGFSSSSMEEIAKASGITAGAIYKHFESKAELLLEVVRRALPSIPLFVQTKSVGALNDPAALVALAADYTEPKLKRVRQLAIEVHSAASKEAKVKKWQSDSAEEGVRNISELIVTAQRAGKIDPELNAEFAARAFVVFVAGLLHMETLFPQLVGDHVWRDFVSDRVAVIIGLLTR